jgi:hypothetical protein
MNQKKICRTLEITRWICVIIGFQSAFFLSGHPGEQLHYLMPWVVLSLMGLSAVESLFFGRAASEITGYVHSGYQRQSGLAMLAVALTALLVLFDGWGVRAEATVLSLTLIFFGLSALNHAWSAFKEGNRGMQNLMRPVLTALLIGFALPFVVRALHAG